MRTTLTIDDDVAVQIEALRRKQGATLKSVVNEALRRGLSEVDAPAKRGRAPFKTRTFDVGKPLLPNIDNIAEVLAAIEGETFK